MGLKKYHNEKFTIHKKLSFSYNIKKYEKESFMDYELMMNSNIRIGQKAPKFNAITTYGARCLEDYKGKWLVFFSHPGDFTPV